MALDLLILSVLRAAPVHGYELKTQVQRPSSTPLSNNSLYPHLKRFEKAGAVTSSVEQQDGKPARRVYAITDAGRRLFADLLATLPPDKARVEEEFLVRLSFFHELEPEARLAILAARLQAIDERIEQVATLAAESTSMPEWRSMALERLLHELRDDRAWVDGLTEKALTEKAGEGTHVHY